ncbi:MAG: hypothetical protein KA932_01245 [Giesbergeria sp.]|nr:hypothetical protein [Giesbergeria sp.]
MNAKSGMALNVGGLHIKTNDCFVLPICEFGYLKIEDSPEEGFVLDAKNASSARLVGASSYE